MVPKLRKWAALALTMPVIAIAAATLIPALTASAFSVGYISSTNYMWGYNEDTGTLIPPIPWKDSSELTYEIVWHQGVGWYTEGENLVQESETTTNFTQFQGDLAGFIETDFYSGGNYLSTYGYLNGSCLIPPWTAWFCQAGSNLPVFYSTGTGDANAWMLMSGDGWETLHGGDDSGSYQWST